MKLFSPWVCAIRGTRAIVRSLAVLVLVSTVAVASGVPATTAAGADDAVDLDTVLVRFDKVQHSILTLSSEFEETVRSPLLKDEISARGQVYLTKPNSVRWEYSVPEEMRFVISNDEYTGYFPQRKRAEKRGIRRWSEQLFRLLGLGQGSEELRKFYEIRLDREAEAPEGVIVLSLEPHKKRVRKRVESVTLWIDGRSFLPNRVEYRTKNGGYRLVEFTGMAVNPQLASNLYHVVIPPDVTVTDGFSALSGLASSGSR